jgi:predicted dehydrogenase
MQNLKVGIIGCGNVSLNVIVPAILATDSVEIACIADTSPERLQSVAERASLGNDSTTNDWRALIARSDVQAIIVATPQQVRPEISIAAVEAGKHLLCEKPLAIAPIDAQRMVNAAHSNGVIFATVHNYVFFPVYKALKEIVDEGEIGDLETVTLNFLGVEDRPGNTNYRPRWRHDARESGGGVLMDMLHAVYLADWFFGAHSTAVDAYIDRRRDAEGDVEDYALVRYSYPNGQAMINMAWGNGPGGVELMGTRGRTILVNKDFGTHPFVPPERIVVVNEHGRRDFSPDSSFVEGHRTVIENFRDAVEGLVVPAATGEDGARVLQAVVGAYKSGAIGEEVRLPLDEDDPVFRLGSVGLAELGLAIDSPIARKGMFGVEVATTVA